MLFKTDKKKNLNFVWEGRGGRNRATDRELGERGEGEKQPKGREDPEEGQQDC